VNGQEGCAYTSPSGDQFLFPTGEIEYYDSFGWEWYANICGRASPTCGDPNLAACYIASNTTYSIAFSNLTYFWSPLQDGRGATITMPRTTIQYPNAKLMIEFICNPTQEEYKLTGEDWTNYIITFQAITPRACRIEATNCGDVCNNDVDCAGGLCPICNLTNACSKSRADCGALCESDWDCDFPCAYCEQNRCHRGCGDTCGSRADCPPSCSNCNFRRQCTEDVCGMPCNTAAECGGACPVCAGHLCSAKVQ